MKTELYSLTYDDLDILANMRSKGIDDRNGTEEEKTLYGILDVMNVNAVKGSKGVLNSYSNKN